MQLDEYTADAICRSMGLDAFVEKSWLTSPLPVLRVLLKPSFDPELCITLARRTDSVGLAVVAAAEMVWHQLAPLPVKSFREQLELPLSVLDEAIDGFLGANTDTGSEGRKVFLDGMSVESCLISDAGQQRLAEQVWTSPVVEFVELMVSVAWNSCRDPRIRNALANAAKYVGIQYPLEREPLETPSFRLIVVGDPDSRSDFFEQLRQRLDKR